MGHAKLRHDNTCLNCGAVVRVRFCSQCGQENTEPKESLGSLLHHFFSDITHFDGKFFSTSKYLLTSPGYLSKEYIDGRRVRYLHPIRMYVFTSAVFFLIFFNAFKIKTQTPEGSTWMSDSLIIKDKNDITFLGFNKYTSVAQYDSAQQQLPKTERDNWLMKRSNRRSIELSQKYKNRSGDFAKDLFDKFFHTFPYLLFISLPLYALYLKLLYRKQKQFYYADHGIFLIHLYIFTFLLLMMIFALNELDKFSGWTWLKWIEILFVLYGVAYTYKGIKKIYGQSRRKTILKFIVFNLLTFISVLLLFFVFFLFTVFQV